MVCLLLIYACSFSGGKMSSSSEMRVMVSPDCPEAEYMFQEAKQMISYISGVKEVDVELTFDPPWTMDRIPDDIKAELGFL